MKTKSEIIDMYVKSLSDLQIHEIKEIQNRIENAASCGKSSIIYYTDYGDKITDNTKTLAQAIQQYGYYVRVGWAETTPCGNPKNFIECSLFPFVEKPFYKRGSFWVNVFIVTVILVGLYLIKLVLDGKI